MADTHSLYRKVVDAGKPKQLQITQNVFKYDLNTHHKPLIEVTMKQDEKALASHNVRSKTIIGSFY